MALKKKIHSFEIKIMSIDFADLFVNGVFERSFKTMDAAKLHASDMMVLICLFENQYCTLKVEGGANG